MEDAILNAINQIYKDYEEIEKSNFIKKDFNYIKDVKNFIYLSIAIMSIGAYRKNADPFADKYLDGYRNPYGRSAYPYFPMSLKYLFDYALTYEKGEFVENYLYAFSLVIRYCMNENRNELIYNVDKLYKVMKHTLIYIERYRDEYHKKYN